MKILLVVATKNELEPYLLRFPESIVDYVSIGNNQVKVLVTGAGILSTGVEISMCIIDKKPDFVLNVGICGAINRDLAFGDVVRVDSEVLADFGAESVEGFIPAEDLGLVDTSMFPFDSGKLVADGCDMLNPLKGLKSQHGITVQKVHGNAVSIEILKNHFPDAEVESMEGAAVFYTCKRHGIPCCQVRSVSNYVEVRNRENWNIPLAIKSLNDFVFQVFSS